MQENILFFLKKKVTQILIVLIFTSSTVLRHEVILVMGALYLVYIAISRSRMKNVSLHVLYNTKINYLFIIFLIGLLMYLFNYMAHPFYGVVRDVSYLLSPIVFLLLGTFFYNKYKDQYHVLDLIVFSALLLSITGVGVFLLNFGSLKDLTSVFKLRNEIRGIDYVSIIGLFLLIYNSDRIKNKTLKRYRYLFVVIISIYFIFSFSRSGLAFITVFILSKNILDRREIKINHFFFTIIMLLLTAGLLLALIPSQFLESYLFKIQRSLYEMSANSNWRNEYNIVWNWRGYEVYCALRQFSDLDFINKIFGSGFGQGVYVGKYAILVTDEPTYYIPLLHNGYYTMMIKCGIVGLIVYAMFYITHFKSALFYLRRTNEKSMEILYFTLILMAAVSTIYLTGIISSGNLSGMSFLIGYLSCFLYHKYYKKIASEK